jgi:serine/threonine-protein kinase
MKPHDWQRLESIFFAALELAPGARSAYLDGACAGNTRLRLEAAAVLAAHRTATVTERPPRWVADTANSRSLSGARIGAYRLEELIGRGGMGEVYRAQRADEQYRQEVAIKLVRSGLAARDLVQRFRVERQILASLQHPNIATLLEGGVTEDGQPFLAMQYVHGVAITEYANAHRLSIEARLQLFRTVCEAVQYAHAHLVVHRDLKPSNILVTEDGQVRLLDFGIAKLLDPSDVGVTVADTGDMLLFTPEHAAPEQLQRKNVSTATDVYALGVLLYELLTGVRPFQAPTPFELYRAVCDREPTRPSGALATRATPLRGDAPVTARLPEPHPEGWARQLRGDLDHIVLKALRKEPARRYASAGQFAEDITRYLEGEPVLARPNSLGYRAARFIKRNRLAVSLTCLAVLSLVAGLLGVSWQAQRARREAHQAEAERDHAQRVSALLVDVFRLADPGSMRGQTVSARDVLAQGAARITRDLSDQPAAQSDLLAELGQIYHNLGLFQEASARIERALVLRRALYGEQDVRVAETLTRLALVRNEQARAREGVELASRAALMLRDQQKTARARAARADALLALGQAQRLVPAPALAAQAYSEALTLLQRDARSADARFARAYFGLAAAAHSQGQFERADSLLQETNARFARLGGPPHPDAASSLNDLGMLRMFRRKPAQAVPLLQQALAQRRSIYGSVHPAVAETLGGLAQALSLLGRYEESAEAGLAAVAVSDSARGNDHTASAHARLALGFTLLKLDQGERALEVLQEANTILRARMGAKSSQTFSAQIMIGQAYASMGQFERARTVFSAALRNVGSALGPEHAYRAHLLMELARLDFDAGRLAQAEARAQESIALVRKVLRPDHRFALWSTLVVAQVRVAQGRLAAADSLLRSVLAAQHATIGEKHPETAQTLVALADVQARRADPDSAAALARTAIAIFEANHERGPSLAEARSVLGGALAALGRREDMTPLLRQSVRDLSEMRSARRMQVVAARMRLRTATD